jgi:hypothetical protein
MSLFRNLFPGRRPDLEQSIKAAEDRSHSLDPFELESEGRVLGPAKRKYRDALDRHWSDVEANKC